MIEIDRDWHSKQVKVLVKPLVVTKETAKQIKVHDGHTCHTINKSELPKNLGYSTPKYIYERGTQKEVLDKLLTRYRDSIASHNEAILEEGSILAQLNSLAKA